MDAQMVLSKGQEALFLLLMVAMPVLMAVLVVGFIVSVFQALTQINEASLSFVRIRRPLDVYHAGGLLAADPGVLAQPHHLAAHDRIQRASPDGLAVSHFLALPACSGGLFSSAHLFIACIARENSCRPGAAGGLECRWRFFEPAGCATERAQRD